MAEEQKIKEKPDFGILKRLIASGWKYKSLFIGCVILAIVLAPLGAILPYLVKDIVDNHILINDIPGLYKKSYIFIGVLLANVLLRYYFLYATSDLGQSVIKDMRNTVFAKLVSLRLRYFDKTPIGTSTTRTISDIQAINEVFTQGVITIVADLLSIVAVLGVMFYTSWRLTIICLLVFPFLIIATRIFQEKVRISYNKVRTQLSNMNAFLQERISGMRMVQIFNAEDRQAKKFREINHAYTGANLDSVFYYAVFFPVVELISALSLALLVWWGAGDYLNGKVSFGALVAFPLYLDLLFRPVRMAADKFNTLQMGLVAGARVYKIIDSDEIIPNTGQIKVDGLKGNIKFDKVGFAYDDENFVINDLSFELKAGETMAIVGSTGSGKSTIINILNRFYDIQKGNIFIDDIAIRDFEITALRKNIAIVLQDVFLFEGTVMENICLKDMSIDQNIVLQAAKDIGAHEFIEKMPGGYDFKITERGNNLSVGQRQLISFVRALVFDPHILILDEATSSIDPESELVIQHAIEKLIAKRTSIIIAHRLTTIRHADKILVMDNGLAVEFGEHDQLMALENGRYRELVNLQQAVEV
ncbi:MAG TPA: ABC transporter ATP-binding protein [Saprospiraceae bacterium]|nr:ABC transporter ATP-binding protein [Saprospiraceae bacterium]HPN67895.1 ABC transporter ATP-binding protein [Saprospiraceae bacterium]